MTHFAVDACAGTYRTYGTLEWPKTWREDSGQACESEGLWPTLDQTHVHVLNTRMELQNGLKLGEQTRGRLAKCVTIRTFFNANVRKMGHREICQSYKTV